ncbi:D-arabinono-1,4-lactone oxidase [Bacillus sp. 165]|uniref:D-arabinono-1,4-lactone oxidase n=1 Tax=Bacillus sp. 165 TaxID=1529117 RepID=UPI001ADB20C0|nr:D-arabinono-1,4-lactone oxidase [Bacillus sp. 165]MBO9129186.1 FAD-binding protein [Bacillus sp. 165]
MKADNKSKIWKNWAGNVQFSPLAVVYPSNIDEVVEAVQSAVHAKKRIRVIGSGHSFTAVTATDELLVSLDRLSGVEAVDHGTGTVEVWAGTKLDELGKSLYKQGYAQENLGDSNVQSVGGAISTGTHGTGAHFGSISTQVVEITAVTAVGEIIKCSNKKKQDIFKAMQVSLGLLGIIVKVKIKVIPKINYIYESNKQSLTEVMENLDVFVNTNRHFAFSIFPYSNDIQVKTMNITDDLASSLYVHRWKTAIRERVILYLLSECCRMFPFLTKWISRLSAKMIPSTRITGPAHRIFTTPRKVKFTEMEYTIPAQCMQDAILEINKAIRKHKFAVHFPIECRYVKKDDIWLSPAYQRNSGYIAVRMYKGMKSEEYFKEVELIVKKYEGRPHWGKMHNMTFEDLKLLYPKLEEFLALRKQLDPNGIFVNPYLAGILNI